MFTGYPVLSGHRLIRSAFSRFPMRIRTRLANVPTLDKHGDSDAALRMAMSALPRRDPPSRVNIRRTVQCRRTRRTCARRLSPFAELTRFDRAFCGPRTRGALRATASVSPPFQLSKFGGSKPPNGQSARRVFPSSTDTVVSSWRSNASNV